MTRAVIWDLDGTLGDSEEYHWLSWQHVLAPEGVSITREQFLASFGQKNDRILRAWIGPDVDAARIARIGDAKEAEYRRLAAERGLRRVREPRRVERRKRLLRRQQHPDHSHLTTRGHRSLRGRRRHQAADHRDG